MEVSCFPDSSSCSDSDSVSDIFRCFSIASVWKLSISLKVAVETKSELAVRSVGFEEFVDVLVPQFVEEFCRSHCGSLSKRNLECIVKDHRCADDQFASSLCYQQERRASCRTPALDVEHSVCFAGANRCVVHARSRSWRAVRSMMWSSPAGHKCEHLRFSPHDNPVLHHHRDTSEFRHAEPIAVHIFATTQQSREAQLVKLQVSSFQMVVHHVCLDPVTSRSRGLLYRKGSQSSFGRLEQVQMDNHLAGLERKCFVAKSQALQDLVVVQIFPQVRILERQWYQKRLTFCNARSRPEGDDIGIQLLNLPLGPVNEALEVMDNWRNLEFHLSPRQRVASMWGSRSLSSLEKEFERLQHFAVPCATLAVPNTTQAKGT